MTPSTDEPRDAHLQAALRHAPDLDQAPPPHLSAQILAQARQAVERPRPAGEGEGLFERWFGWLSQPAAAGAFGTLVVAGFIGLLWREGPPPEAMPGAEPPVAVTAPAPVATAAGPPVDGPVKAPVETPVKVAKATPPAPPMQARQVPPKPSAAPPTATPPELRAEPEREQQPAPAPAAPQPPSPVAAAPAAVPVPVPVTVPSPAPLPAAAPAPPKVVVAATEKATTAADNTAELQRQPLATAPAAATASRLTAAAFDPMAQALASLTAPADSVWRDRLLLLRGQVQGPWTAARPTPTDGGETISNQAGVALGRLWVDDGQLTWQAPDGRTWRARRSTSTPAAR